MKDGEKIAIKTSFLGENQNNNKQETLIFLNGSFFNQEQWKSDIQILKFLIPKTIRLKVITYDYRGTGESSSSLKSYKIKNFLDEIKAIVHNIGGEKVHIFGKSLGAWIGLNAYIICPSLVKTFVGYGNIAPFHPSYSEKTLSNIKTVKTRFNNLEGFKDQTITQENWFELFRTIYLPIFFPEMSKRLQEGNINQVIEKMAKALYPLVKGNSLQSYNEFFTYLTRTIFNEGKFFLKKLHTQRSNIPILFINGKQDLITDPRQTSYLHKKIPHSEIFLIESLNHGSLILNKGIKTVYLNYLHFINIFKKPTTI